MAPTIIIPSKVAPKPAVLGTSTKIAPITSSPAVKYLHHCPKPILSNKEICICGLASFAVPATKNTVASRPCKIQNEVLSGFDNRELSACWPITESSDIWNIVLLFSHRSYWNWNCPTPKSKSIGIVQEGREALPQVPA